MKIESGLTTDDEDRSVVKTMVDCRFKSRFKFLSGHDGLRPGELICLIGPKGGSKSTIARSIMLENAMDMKRVLAVLSEESVSTYRYEMKSGAKKVCELFEKDSNIVMENMFFITLLGLAYKNFDKFKADFRNAIAQVNPDIIYFDNFTTSFICSMPFQFQSMAINFFKDLAVELDIPFVLILHTVKGTDIYKRFVEGDDVRADATSVNFGSYNYVISTYFRLKPPRSFIYIDKARYHGNMNKKVFELEYDKGSGIFISDRVSELGEIKACMEKGDLSKGSKF